MFIPGDAQDDSRGMLAKILVNSRKDWTLYYAIKQKQNQRIYTQV